MFAHIVFILAMTNYIKIDIDCRFVDKHQPPVSQQRGSPDPTFNDNEDAKSRIGVGNKHEHSSDREDGTFLTLSPTEDIVIFRKKRETSEDTNTGALSDPAGEHPGTFTPPPPEPPSDDSYERPYRPTQLPGNPGGTTRPFGPPGLPGNDGGTTRLYGPPGLPGNDGGTTSLYGPPGLPGNNGGTTRQYGPPSPVPPEPSPRGMAEGTTRPYGPPAPMPTQPPPAGNQCGTTRQYGPPAPVPPRPSPPGNDGGTTPPYGPPSFGPPGLPWNDGGTTRPYGPPAPIPTEASPPGNLCGTTSPYGPPELPWNADGTTSPYEPPPVFTEDPLQGGAADEDHGSPPGDIGRRPSIETLEESLSYITDTTFRNLSIRLAMMCGDTPFCKYANEVFLVPREYCCSRAKCRCDSLCDKTGSCCADNQPTTDDTLDRASNILCKPPLAHRPTGQTYEFVGTCPSTSSDEERDSCEHFITGRVWSDWRRLPVFDRDATINYDNLYCAICNGARMEHLSMWLAHEICPDTAGICNSSATALRGDDWLGLDGGRCIREYLPPSLSAGVSTSCYEDEGLITACNSSGLWVEYDQSVEEGCFLLNLHFQVNNQVFKNIFCAMCNGMSLGHVTCPYEPMFTLPCFSTLLVYHVPAVISERECEHGMAFDPVSGQCQTIDCFRPRILDTDGNTCSGTLLQYNASYNVLLRVESDSQNPTAGTLKQMAELWAMSFFGGFIDPDYIHCGAQLYGKTAMPSSAILNTVDEIEWEHVEITSTILNIRLWQVIGGHTMDILESPFRLHRVMEAVVSYMSQYERVTVIKDGYDPWLLDMNRIAEQMEAVERQAHSAEESEKEKTYWFPFENPYNNSVILASKMPPTTDLCDSFIDRYGQQTITCPTFLYNMREHEIERVSSGIRFVRENVEFDFYEFRSVNQTHVRVCVESIIQKVPRVRSNVGIINSINWNYLKVAWAWYVLERII